MIRKLRFSLCLAALFLVQTAVAHRFSYGALRPDLLLIAAAYPVLEARYRGALGAAFAVGLLRDLGGGGALGAGALVLVSAAALVVPLREGLLRESFYVDLVLACVFVAACSAGDLLVGLATTSGVPSRLLQQAFGQAAFTCALLPLGLSLLANLHLVEPRGAFQEL